MFQGDVERLRLFFQVTDHFEDFQQEFADFMVENALDFEDFFNVFQTCRDVLNDSALSSEVVEFTLMADA